MGSEERWQPGSRIFHSAVDVLVRAEFFCELPRLRTETNGHSPEPHPSCVLNPEVSESANPLDCDEGTATQAGISQGVARRHTCTYHPSCLPHSHPVPIPSPAPPPLLTTSSLPPP